MIDMRLQELGMACGCAEVSAEALASIRRVKHDKALSEDDIAALVSMAEIVEDSTLQDIFRRLAVVTAITEEDIERAQTACNEVLKQSLGIVGALSRC